MRKTFIVDCENLNSILDSLSIIYDTDHNKILSYFNKTNLDDIWEKSLQKKYGSEYLFEDFQKVFKRNQDINLKAYWFHNTRVVEGTDFKEGILPLEKAIVKVENTLNEVIHNLGLQINYKKPGNSRATICKLNSDYDQGPWGFLIKDFAFEKNNGVHDYLSAPELVEDILSYKYPENYNLILNGFQKATKKCIVKCKSDRDFHPETLEYVVNYLYHKINNLEMYYRCNTNITNFRKTISPNKIVKVSYYE